MEADKVTTIKPKPPTVEEFSVIATNINMLPDLPTKNVNQARIVSWVGGGLFVGSLLSWLLANGALSTVVVAGALAYLAITHRVTANTLGRTLMYAVMMHQTVQSLIEELANNKEPSNEPQDTNTEVR